jgi:hypothetical protein
MFVGSIMNQRGIVCHIFISQAGDTNEKALSHLWETII